MTVAAAALAACVLWDQFVTVFSTSGAGPMTRTVTHFTWRGLLRIHRHRPIHGVLKFAGPAMLLLGIISRYLLIGLALFMALVAFPGSVVNSTTKEPAQAIETLYFTNTSLSSLGYGDWVPSGPPWTFLSTLTTLAETIVLTISLSYVLSVIAAAIGRRSLATSIFALGETEEEILNNLNLNDSQGSLKNYLLGLGSAIDRQGLSHLAYPVLKYFHGTQRKLSPARAVLLLSDTNFLLELDGARQFNGLTQVMRKSIENFAEFSRAGLDRAKEAAEGRQRLRQLALKLRHVENSAEFDRAFDGYAALRAKLVALCEEDGWG